MQNELSEFFMQAKDLLRKEMSEISFNTWFKDLELLEKNGDTYVLGVTSEFQKDAIMGRYFDLILNTFILKKGKTSQTGITNSSKK